MQRPTIMKMKGLITEAANAGGPPGDELAGRIQVTQGRIVRTGNLLSICVTVAIVGMALAG
jgi:hypothetical protein